MVDKHVRARTYKQHVALAQVDEQQPQQDQLGEHAAQARQDIHVGLVLGGEIELDLEVLHQQLVPAGQLINHLPCENLAGTFPSGPWLHSGDAEHMHCPSIKGRCACLQRVATVVKLIAGGVEL